MEDDTDKLGMRFTDERIRHHLQQAYELWPADWKTRLRLMANSPKR
jgi:hypothetical protein